MSNEINTLSFIKSSKNRTKIILSINNDIKIPSEISKDTNIRLNYVSALLLELKEAGIVTCLNEESKKGRLYKLTKEGKHAIKTIRK